MAWTDDLPSPRVFREWAAIWAIGAAGRRRIWTMIRPGLPLFPNMYIWLVGPPATGKTVAIVPATETLRRSDTAKLAPNDMTKQALLDRLSKSPDAVTFEGPPPRIVEYHYMALAVRELSNFMNQYDSAMAGILTDLFDNPPVNEELKRSGHGGVIVNPGISMLAGTATKNLGVTIGSALWGQGFMSRVLMIYSADKLAVNYFGDDAEGFDDADHKAMYNPSIVHQLTQIGAMKGRVAWDPGAQKAFHAWIKRDQEPKPKHPKLFEYLGRRDINVGKLAMINAMSNLRMTITEADFDLALSRLEASEAVMPEIFKEMVMHSDGEIAREMLMHAFSLWSIARKPVHYSQLAAFLMTKVAARDIKRIIENSEEAGMFDRLAGTTGVNAQYIPKLTGRDLPE